MMEADDGPRPNTTTDVLSTLKPVFKEGGTVTAGNACPLNDGAAALVVMSQDRAEALGISPLAKVVATSVAALEPEYMGLGPIPATEQVLRRAGMTMADIDRVELLGDVEDCDDHGALYRRPWRLPADCGLLEDRILASGLDVVVVDGLGYAVQGDSHNYGVIGSALSALAAVAERTGVSLIGITHPPKGTSSPVTAAIGSTAWTAIPRIVWVLGLDPEDESRRGVRIAKSAYETPTAGIAFSIENDELYETGMVTNVTATEVSAEDLVTAPATQEEKGERAEARDLLRSLLAPGPMETGDVLRKMRAAGVNDATTKRARRDLGVTSTQHRDDRTGHVVGWRLSLPETSRGPEVHVQGTRGSRPGVHPHREPVDPLVSTRTFTCPSGGPEAPEDQRLKNGPLGEPLDRETVP